MFLRMMHKIVLCSIGLLSRQTLHESAFIMKAMANNRLCIIYFVQYKFGCKPIFSFRNQNTVYSKPHF